MTKIDSRKFPSSHNAERIARLNENLRLNHIVKGADAIRSISAEFVDLFKLPGDKLTATNAAIHCIPTPAIPEGRAITLNNYRLAETHKQEVKCVVCDLERLTSKTMSRREKRPAKSLPARKTFLYVIVNHVNQLSSHLHLVEYTVHHVFDSQRASYYR
jgi:hypothetical protein